MVPGLLILAACKLGVIVAIFGHVIEYGAEIIAQGQRGGGGGALLDRRQLIRYYFMADRDF